MKFRKKPVVIEAIKWDGTDDAFSKIQSLNTLARGLKTNGMRGDKAKLWIDTLEGTHEAQCGDMVIQGVSGELYPCKPDIFELTYEKAED